jgi:hypothetical protein
MEVYCAVNNYFNFDVLTKNQNNILKSSNSQTYKGIYKSVYL